LAGHSPSLLRLALLDTFELSSDGALIPLSLPAQRLLAYLALQARPLRRVHVASVLWPDSTETHAAGSLRSALWKLRQSGHTLVDETDHQLQLSSAVSVDVRRTATWAARVLRPSTTITSADILEAMRFGELLRDWYEDWVLLERERLRQLRAHALEVLCERLTRAGRFNDAMEVGLAAVGNDPLRESAHRAVMRVHLAEGNRAEAVRQYAYFERLLGDELGFEPSPRMRALVAASR
jgi:DNA-binding SARP family transcriptional activator